MDIIQGLIETGNAGKSGWRIVNNGGAIGVLNNRTSNVYFSILNDGGIGTSSNVPSSLINSYSGINVSNYSGTGSVVSTGGTGGTGGSSQWTTSGSKIYYNNGNVGNVGIGTLDPIAPLHIYNNAITAVLPTEIVVAGATSATISGTTDRYISFPYSGSATTKDYTFTTTEALICDILIVGGGGAGGTYIGGGGGAGGVLYIQNVNIGVGTYNISVGRGGVGFTGAGASTTLQNGSSSKAFGIEVFGGGYGGAGGWGTGGNGQTGGSGGSGGAGGSAPPPSTAGVGGGVSQPSFTNSLITVNTYNYYGGNGATSMIYNGIAGIGIGANGGGGAGGNAPANTDQANAGAGADGIAINITGTSYFWGGGGGGGQYNGVKAGNGGKGGGGGGNGSQESEGVGIGGTGGITLGQDGDLEGDGTPTAGNGGDGTGGGGGGTGRTIGSPNAISGSGGSGIVIIRYRRQTQPSVSNARLLLDATTTGTATVEFRRGTGADAQNDYRFINDSNGSIKLQCENTTQVFGNTVADLAWFSSNETIIHKNTTMNGRVGIGTVYHASRSLDVVGDANISGVLSVAGSLSVTSNAIITNSITSNTSFTIHNGLSPPLPNVLAVVPLPNEIVVAGTTTGIIGADRFISFPYSGSATTKDYTFTTTENLICDILMIGGGGAGGFDRAGGGGAGSCIVALSQTLSTGTYNIKVGSGQAGISNNTTSGTGGDSEIFLSSSILYRAKGGGNGGAAAVNNATAGGCGGGAASQGPFDGGSATNLNYIAGNLVNANTTTTTYANLGFKGGNQLVGWNGSNGNQMVGAGGGGIGGAGINHNVGEIIGTAGGTSLDRVIINTSTYIFKDYFAGGGTLGVNGFIGGGGGGGGGAGSVGNGGGGGAGNGGGVSATSNTGSGGGGGASGSGSGGAGGSGIVIIRYRKAQGDIINETISGIVGTADRYTIFPYSGNGATKDYSITTTENLGCDILMIGGGGGGGVGDAGGGGAGACIVAINQSLNAGNYTIRVGNGGIGGILSSTGTITRLSTDGVNSSIFNSSGIEIYRAVGGGEAGNVEGDYVSITQFIGKTGGCGGGAGFWQGNTGVSGGAVSTLNIVNSVQNISPSVSTTYGVYGNVGGNSVHWNNSYPNANCGGGGGIGVAGSAGIIGRSGVGGNGLAQVTINSTQYNFKTYFAPDWSSFGVLSGGLLYIGGGGGGAGFASTANQAKISGGLGGGGIGDYAGNKIVFADAPTNGMANTGSGGGGACGNAGSYGGAGGSGLIIVRYRKLPNEIVVTGTTSTVIGSTDRCIVFPYSGSATTKDYTFTTTEALSCDVLIVGGGGQGGCTDAGAGGAGGLVFILNKSFTSGTYTINVGSGGIDVGSYGVSRAGTNGSDTIINFGGNTFLVAKGGGGGGTGFSPEYSGVSGGSGGGAGSTVDDVNKKIGASSIQSQQAGDSSTYGYGNKGGDNNTEGTYYGGGGGGGASEAGKNGGLNSNQGIGGNGLAQLTLSGTIYNFKTFFGLPTSGVGEYISGEDNIYFAGGGGGGHTYNIANATSQDKNGGKGGGGQGKGNGNGVAGLATTGGGGGGGGGGHGRGGNGGSGIVIIRYRLPTSSTSSSINFIRGTTADTNHDYKVGNFNGEFKVISSVLSASNIDTEYIRITTAGAITNPSGTANWNIGSDRRIKENIERASYDKCFENINRLELNRFNYVSGFNTVNRDRTQLGFIAQEVSDIFPKSISSQGYYSDTLNIPDLLSIDVSQINYSLYGAVKKLIEINNEKDNRLKALDDELKTIETILNITPETVASNVVLEPVIISMTSNVVLEEMTSNITVDS